MPKRTDISTILIIGAGPIVIGQACEFDYSGTQAVKTLKEEGYRIVLGSIKNTNCVHHALKRLARHHAVLNGEQRHQQQIDDDRFGRRRFKAWWTQFVLTRTMR